MWPGTSSSAIIRSVSTRRSATEPRKRFTTSTSIGRSQRSQHHNSYPENTGPPRITGNWRGRPLETYQTIVSLIANTTTVTGLTVRADLDLNLYPTGIKPTAQQRESIPITRHEFHGDWNYTIRRPRE